MSRTYKDRPYWVKNNDSRYDRVEDHDHHNIGRKVLRKQNVVDENGELVMEEVEYIKRTPESEFDFASHKGHIGWNFWGTSEAKVYRATDYTPRFYGQVMICERLTKLVPKTELVPMPFYDADYCTIDEPDTRWQDRSYLPCTHSLAHYEQPNSYTYEYRRNKERDTSRARLVERHASTKLLKELRYVDLEEILDEEYLELTDIPNYRIQYYDGWD